jgi:hypothetical protein
MLAELRAEIADELKAGGFDNVADYTVNSPRPPCAVVIPSQNYLVAGSDDQGNVYGEFNVGIDVLILASRDVNKKNAAQMDALLEKGLAALLAQDRDVQRVTRPGVVTMPETGIKYLGAVVTIAETWEAPDGS